MTDARTRNQDLGLSHQRPSALNLYPKETNLMKNRIAKDRHTEKIAVDKQSTHVESHAHVTAIRENFIAKSPA